MYSRVALLFLGLASLASAVPTPQPLNINLGAYSPAFVVGDGEISFGGAEAAGAGEGGAAEAVPVEPVAAPATEQVVEGTPAEAEAESEAVDTQSVTTVSTQLQGMGKQRLPDLRA